MWIKSRKKQAQNIAIKIERLLIKHEGIHLKPYRCPAGRLTLGIGRNIQDNGISEDEAIGLLNNDLARCADEFKEIFVEPTRLPPARFAAILDMLFNLGRPRFETFKKMIAAIKAEDFEIAADEMLNSKWAKQVGTRAETLAEMMRSGEWPDFLAEGE